MEAIRYVKQYGYYRCGTNYIQCSDLDTWDQLAPKLEKLPRQTSMPQRPPPGSSQTGMGMGMMFSAGFWLT